MKYSLGTVLSQTPLPVTSVSQQFKQTLWRLSDDLDFYIKMRI